jgi:hypothetical protein
LSMYSDRMVVPQAERWSWVESAREMTRFISCPAARTPFLSTGLLPLALARLERTRMLFRPLARITVPVPPRPACLARIRPRLIS